MLCNTGRTAGKLRKDFKEYVDGRRQGSSACFVNTIDQNCQPISEEIGTLDGAKIIKSSVDCLLEDDIQHGEKKSPKGASQWALARRCMKPELLPGLLPRFMYELNIRFNSR